MRCSPGSLTEYSHMVSFPILCSIFIYSLQYIRFSGLLIPSSTTCHSTLGISHSVMSPTICSNSHPKGMLAPSLSVLAGMSNYTLINSPLANFAFHPSSFDSAPLRSSPICIFLAPINAHWLQVMFNLTLFTGLSIENSFWEQEAFLILQRRGLCLVCQKDGMLAFKSEIYVIPIEKLYFQENLEI